MKELIGLCSKLSDGKDHDRVTFSLSSGEVVGFQFGSLEDRIIFEVIPSSEPEPWPFELDGQGLESLAKMIGKSEDDVSLKGAKGCIEVKTSNGKSKGKHKIKATSTEPLLGEESPRLNDFGVLVSICDYAIAPTLSERLDALKKFKPNSLGETKNVDISYIPEMGLTAWTARGFARLNFSDLGPDEFKFSNKACLVMKTLGSDFRLSIEEHSKELPLRVLVLIWERPAEGLSVRYSEALDEPNPKAIALSQVAKNMSSVFTFEVNSLEMSQALTMASIDDERVRVTVDVDRQELILESASESYQSREIIHCMTEIANAETIAFTINGSIFNSLIKASSGSSDVPLRMSLDDATHPRAIQCAGGMLALFAAKS